MAVQLHPQLAEDTGAIAETRDYWLRWMNDRRFPWIIVVPRGVDVQGIHELSAAARHELMDRASSCARALEEVTGADRINIGVLGNQVPQLHVHVVARFEEDVCWPGPVWGNGTPRPYGIDELPVWLQGFRECIGNFL